MRPCLPTGLPRAVPPSALLLLLLAAARAAHSAHNDDLNQLLQELTGPAVLARARRRVLESRVTASLSSWPTLDSEVRLNAYAKLIQPSDVDIDVGVLGQTGLMLVVVECINCYTRWIQSKTGSYP
eukprot:2623157-Pleurochrysis_carterae.AAC.1